MYREQALPGKGVGCVAITKIKKGTLVVREKPILLLDRRPGSYLARVTTAFLAMAPKEQEGYLALANKYSINESRWSDYSNEFKKVRDQEMKSFGTGKLSGETITSVWQILETNSFNNGVCLKISRFNHSCRPNAEFFWNHDTGTRDVRAVRMIKPSEEITLNYRKLGTLTREERMTYLRDYHHFECLCEACDKSEAEVEQESLNCAQFRKLEEARKVAEEGQTENNFSLKLNRDEIESLKKMYSLAREMKIFRLASIVKNIVEEGFNAACQGFYNTRFQSQMLDLRGQLLKDAHMFAEAGLQLSTTVFGKEHTTTQLWARRRKEPIACFLEEMCS